MTIRVLYFAGLRESLDCAEESLALPDTVCSVEALRAHLAGRGGLWPALARAKNLRVAVNQQMVAPEALVGDGDEVAFFPPVTGG